MTRTSRLTCGVALVVALVLGVFGSTAVAVWTLTADGSGATRSASLTAPTNVSVTQSPANPQTSMVVSWTTPDSQLPGASYVVNRSSGGGAATKLSCSSSPCTDTGLTAGTTYTYSVTADLQSWVSTAAVGEGGTAAAAVSTTTTVASDATPSVVGQLVTYTATVSAASGTPNGNVAFNDGAGTISGCASQQLANGKTTCSVRYTSTGSRSITASFPGSSRFLASTSTALSQQVDKASTTTKVSTAQSPVRTGTPVTLTATVAAAGLGSGTPTGTVEFKDGATTISGCSAQPLSVVANEVRATCSASFITVGARSLTAVYGGDAGFLTSTAATTPQRVTNGNVVGISFTGVTVDGAAVSVTCQNAVGSASYTCNTPAAAGKSSNNKVVIGTPVFVLANGSTQAAYASDAATSLSWTSTGKNATSGSLSVGAGASASSATVTAEMSGSNAAQVTVTMTDATGTMTATLRVS